MTDTPTYLLYSLATGDSIATSTDPRELIGKAQAMHLEAWGLVTDNLDTVRPQVDKGVSSGEIQPVVG